MDISVDLQAVAFMIAPYCFVDLELCLTPALWSDHFIFKFVWLSFMEPSTKLPSMKRSRTPSNDKRFPHGDERMKRRPPSDMSLIPERFEDDPKKAYTVEQLAEIGAITLKWNQIEASIDFIGSFILFSKAPYWLRIATDRAIGTNGKLRLLRECIIHATLLDNQAKNCILDCFAEVEQCRAYRNAIIHHHIYDHAKGIGSYVDESKSNYQILVSIDALRTLYNILRSLLLELREIDILYRIETDAQRPGRLDEKTGKFHVFDDEYLKTKILPENVERISKLQDQRKAIQKLPHFPDADLVRSLNEQAVPATRLEE